MKTLPDHVILYDGDFPMCSLYTKTFVASGMITEGGRQPYQSAGPRVAGLDRDRAVNEIALIDRKTGTVTYGVRSLFAVLANRFPVLKPLFRFGPFVWAMTVLYRFISFNRRVIMPARPSDGMMPEPAPRPGYRAAYLILTWLVTALILTGYSHHLEGLMPPSRFYREFLVCGGQILWQSTLLRILRKRMLLDYLGNMMTISFAGGLALWILQAALSLGGITEPIVYAVVFMGVAGAMFAEHLRRSSLLGWGPWPSVSWVAYRVVVLLYLIN
jgi:hypothetical protein